jgi:NADH dehydrogenase/NADH:ubiquinone oxidoreductase subunit G
MEPVFLRVPAASLNDLALLGEGMSAQGFHYASYITRIGFNPEKPHPQMTFRALQALTDKEAPVVLPLREDPTAIRITGESEVGKGRPAAIAAVQTTTEQTGQVDPAAAAKAQAALAAAAKAQAEAVAKAQAEAAKAAADAAAKAAADAAAKAAAAAGPIDTGFGDIGTTAVAQAPTPTLTPGPGLDTGFGVTATVAVQQPTTVTNTVADTGAPEDADAELDARIASLMPK